MPITKVKTPDGSIVKVKHPEGASKSTIMRYAAETHASKKNQPTEEASVSEAVIPTDMTAGEAARLALTDFAERLVPDIFIYGPPKDAINNSTYAEREARREEFKRETAGVDPNAEADFGANLIRGVLDPMNLVGSRVPTSIANLATTLANAGATVAGTAAGEATAAAVYETDLPPFAKELVAATLAPLAGTVAGGPTAAAVQTGTDAVGRYVRKLSPSQAGEIIANTGVQAKLDSIRALEGENLESRVRAFQDLKEVVPGLDLPFASLADENPIVAAWLKEVSSADIEFRGNLVKKMAEESKKVDDAFKALFPEVTAPADPASVRAAMKNRMDVQVAEAEKTLKSKMKGLRKREDALIKKLSSSEDYISLGEKVEKLANAKESIVRNEADKLYKKAINGSRRRKSVLPETNVADIYNTTRSLRIRDIFGTMPEVMNKLQKRWAPDPETKEFTPVPLEEFHSLRKATNKAISKTTDNEKKQKLFALKRTLDSTLDSVIKSEDPTFYDEYMQANEFYYKEVGLPLRAEGMQAIDRQKFYATSAQQLSNPEKATDFINFVGEKEGLPVLRHAVRLLANQKNVVDSNGRVNEGALRKFVLENSRLIDLAQMKLEFGLTQKEIKTIRDSAAKHEEYYNKAALEATDGFFKTVLDMELPQVVDTMLNKPSKREKYRKQIELLPEDEQNLVFKGLQQGFLDKAFNHSGTMMDYIRKHRDAAVELFGKRHVENVEQLSKVTDLLFRIDNAISRSMGRVHTVDIFQQRTGVSFAEGSGLLRNQVLSTERKAINFVAKAMASKTGEAKENLSGKVLLSTDVMETLANPPKGWEHYARALKEGSIEELRTLGQTFNQALTKVLPLQAYRGAVGGEVISRERILEEE